MEPRGPWAIRPPCPALRSSEARALRGRTRPRRAGRSPRKSLRGAGGTPCRLSRRLRPARGFDGSGTPRGSSVHDACPWHRSPRVRARREACSGPRGVSWGAGGSTRFRRDHRAGPGRLLARRHTRPSSRPPGNRRRGGLRPRRRNRRHRRRRPTGLRGGRRAPWGLDRSRERRDDGPLRSARPLPARSNGLAPARVHRPRARRSSARGPDLADRSTVGVDGSARDS